MRSSSVSATVRQLPVSHTDTAICPRLHGLSILVSIVRVGEVGRCSVYGLSHHITSHHITSHHITSHHMNSNEQRPYRNSQSVTCWHSWLASF
ncbi:hypothetical protein Pmani_022017 [Petrolisthes manimaculis]|uniref:Uncharacterized protein n=1 Tax=Petrolisthes manimaculis TaxID=1843537 RepID=A0AAE1PDQ9_9EUCA|nr:hypothetical protein Pmani_022017 [Petrolisthes manimaculis]